MAGPPPVALLRLMKERSNHVVVDSFVDVKSWAEHTPDVDAVRPARCPRCGVAGCPVGGRLGMVGHGLRSRQVRGPLTAEARSAVHTLRVRRYRCRPCEATVTVLPRGVVRARHFSATAIALACAMYALAGASLRATRKRVSPWASTEPGWPAMGRWLDAIARGSILAVRSWPSGWTRRLQAERVAQAVLAAVAGQGPWAVRAFAGAERLCCS